MPIGTLHQFLEIFTSYESISQTEESRHLHTWDPPPASCWTGSSSQVQPSSCQLHLERGGQRPSENDLHHPWGAFFLTARLVTRSPDILDLKGEKICSFVLPGHPGVGAGSVWYLKNETKNYQCGWHVSCLFPSLSHCKRHSIHNVCLWTAPHRHCSGRRVLL